MVVVSRLTVRVILAALLSPVLLLVGALLAGSLLWRHWRRPPNASP